MRRRRSRGYPSKPVSPTTPSSSKAKRLARSKPSPRVIHSPVSRNSRRSTSKAFPSGFPRGAAVAVLLFESTGTDRDAFANRLDPEPRSRNVFAFHRPETLLTWIDNHAEPQSVTSIPRTVQSQRQLANRIQHMPPLIDNIWPPKPQAIMNIEQSLRDNRPRALVHWQPARARRCWRSC